MTSSVSNTPHHPPLGPSRSGRKTAVTLLLAALASLASPISAIGQVVPDARTLGVVLGTVVDAESGEPLSTVHIAVRASLGDSVVLATTLTDREGRFNLTEIPPGDYYLTFGLIGYADLSREMTLAAETTSTTSLGSLTMTPAALVLDGLDVITTRPAVTYEADRDVYSVDAMATAAGGSASDVLSNIPDLEVDPDGKVSLRGEAPTIYIDGRPAPMRGESLDDFLQGFPAENIENIEVMSNPSARYESEGTGGVVNIVLKRGVSLGLTGNYSINAGSRGELGTSGRISRQSGPLSLNGSGSLRMTGRESNTSELRQNLRADPVTYLGQDALSDRSTWSGNIDLRAEYSLSEETTLNARGRFRSNDSGSDRITTYTEMEADWSIVDQYDRTVFSESFGNSADASFELRHDFAPRNHRLTVEGEYQTGRDDDESITRRRIIADDFPENEVFQLLVDEAREHETQLSLRLDYNRPLAGGQIELGLGSRIASDDVGRDRRRGVDAPDSELIPYDNPHFRHRETINSLYLTGSRRIGDLNAQLGFRAEHTTIDFALPGQSTNVGNSYLNVFPNANLSYQLGDGKRLRLSYSVRVRRPTASVINPVDRSSDPTHRRVGNPEVDPQFTHSFGFDASWSGRLGTLRLSPFLRRSVDEWAQFKSVDEHGIATTTHQNLAQTTSYGSSLTASARGVLGIFDPSMTVNAQRQNREWDVLVGRDPRVTTRWSVRSNLNARVSRSLNVQSSLTYTPPREMAQGSASDTIMTNLGIRQRLLDNRASINLSFTDPLGLYRTSTRTSDPSYIESNSDRASARRGTISFSYSFGSRGNAGRGR